MSENEVKKAFNAIEPEDGAQERMYANILKKAAAQRAAALEGNVDAPAAEGNATSKTVPLPARRPTPRWKRYSAMAACLALVTTLTIGFLHPFFDGGNVASSVYYGLLALQHRGQESCGIAVSDTDGPKGKVLSSKDMGLLNEAFTPEILEKLKGDIGVGHVRYSTAGSSTRENAQPLVLNYVKGTLGLAHNGNLINAPELRRELEYTGAIFQTTIDSEVIAYHIARERLNSKTVEEAVGRAMKKLKGAYSLIVMSPRKLIGARDPFGFRPLCIGKRDHAYILASETCALDTIGAEFVRDVQPGEIVTISPEKGIESDTSMCLPSREHARCVFEYIYFARPDSYFDGMSVYNSRILAGKFLAMDSPVEADLVVGVPESGNCAALGYSLQSGIPYGQAFVKNGYVGRTFIKPKQKNRESSVQVKLNALKEAVEGKRIIMIDDSIVRGTTSDRIVHMLRKAGAKCRQKKRRCCDQSRIYQKTKVFN